MGCDDDGGGCIGYELARDLDFAAAGGAFANGGLGWEPIGAASGWDAGTQFEAVFHGNGRLIENLRVNRPSRDQAGLFAALGLSAEV